MSRIAIFMLMVVLSIGSFAQQPPRPFGLKLGVSTKDQLLEIIKSEGGLIESSTNRFVRGSIKNPDVEIIVVNSLPIDGLIHARFWLFKGILYKIEYYFSLSPEADQFYSLVERLELKYGKPKNYIKPVSGDGIAEWNFKCLHIYLHAPHQSTVMTLTYKNSRVERQADLSDIEMLSKEIINRNRGL